LHSRNIEKIVGCCCSILPIILQSTFLHCRIHRLCPFLHNPIVPRLMCLHLQTIVMRHCQEKVMHVLLLIVWFVVLDIDDYFVFVAFQMVRPTLYIAWHTVLSTSNCNVHVQISTCLDWILLEH
jgi:hypothetical protein